MGRWKATVLGFRSELVASSVDISAGIINFCLRIHGSREGEAFVSLIDRQSCVQVKSSPAKVKLPEVCPDGQHTSADLDGRRLAEVTEVAQRSQFESPRARTSIYSISRSQFVESDTLDTESLSPGPRANLKAGHPPLGRGVERRERGRGVILEPMERQREPRSIREQSDASKEKKAILSSLLGRGESAASDGHGGKEWVMRSPVQQMPPGRYMPIEPLPSHAGWGKKKSKSPRKRRYT